MARNLKLWILEERDCTICVTKTKTLISCAVTAQLICVFVFAYAGRGRYVLLAFDCMLVVGIYFCADMPSALLPQIQGMQVHNCTVGQNISACCDDCLGLGPDQYNLLYTIYSWTSAVMILPVGFAIDKMGNRISALLFTGIASTGTFIFAMASLSDYRGTDAMFPLMLVGRLLLGAGTGSSRIVRDRVIAFWFRDKLALAFGIAVSTMGLGSVLTFLFTSNMAQWIGLTETLFVGAGICSTCFVSAIFLCLLDWYGSAHQPIRRSTRRRTTKEKTVTKLSGIKKFPLSFWLICLMTTTFYCFQLVFTANGSKFIHERYDTSKTVSSYYNGAVYDVSVFLSPIVGIVLQKIGHRGQAALLGAVLTIPVGPLLLFTDMTPLVGTIWIGITFTVTAVSLWSSIPYTVPTSSVGTANGIASCMMDLTVGLTSLATGQIMTVMQNPDGTICETGWKYTFLLLFGHVTLCACLGVLLNFYSRKKDAKLNSCAKHRPPSLGPCQFPESDDDAVITNTEIYITQAGEKKEIITENESFYTKSAHPNGLYKINIAPDIKNNCTGNDFMTKIDNEQNDLHSNGIFNTVSYLSTEKYSEENQKQKCEKIRSNGFHDVKF